MKYLAFEGPDKTGKSTDCNTIGTAAFYNATKQLHEENHHKYKNKVGIVCYDRIDWLTHMVYRLAMPDHEWNDERVRTVFAMPDTHLIIKVHSVSTVGLIQDELGYASLAEVNDGYCSMYEYLTEMNSRQNNNLFASISLVEVTHNQKTKSFHEVLLESSLKDDKVFYPQSSQWSTPKIASFILKETSGK